MFKETTFLQLKIKTNTRTYHLKQIITSFMIYGTFAETNSVLLVSTFLAPHSKLTLYKTQNSDSQKPLL
jgi:hypothetical protein